MTDEIRKELDLATLKLKVEKLEKELLVAKKDRDEALEYAAKMREQVKGAYPKREYNPVLKKWD